MESLLKQKRATGQFYWQVSQDYDVQESRFAAAVAAAAFAVNSIEEAEEDHRRKIQEDLQRAKSKMKTIEESSTTGSVRVTKGSTGKEVKYAGETSNRKPNDQDRMMQESAFPSRKPSRSTSTRPTKPADQRQRGNSTTNFMSTNAESWERARLLKIHKRYEKLKSKIYSWENEKKMQAKLHMERKKSELELRKTRNSQHYQVKLTRIDMIAGGARAQLEEKRRNEEVEVKEKAKYMRTKGRNPVMCFCC